MDIQRPLHKVFSRLTFIGMNIFTPGVLAVLGYTSQQGGGTAAGTAHHSDRLDAERHSFGCSGALHVC